MEVPMDMVERVTKAIEAAMDAGSPTGWAGEFEIADLARAAIAAMREPTEGMVQTVEYHFTNGGKGQYLRDLYKIMIDVALGTLPPQKLWSVIEDEKRRELGTK
jgi:hypothetical protein